MITKVMPSAISIGGAAATRMVADVVEAAEVRERGAARSATHHARAPRARPGAGRGRRCRSVRSAWRTSAATTAAGTSRFGNDLGHRVFLSRATYTAMRMMTACTISVGGRLQVVLDHGGDDQLHEQRAGHRAEDPDLAAGQRGAADHHRGDRGELDQQADRGGVAGLDAGHREHAGDRGEHRADHVHGDQHPLDRQTGQLGRRPGCRRSRAAGGRRPCGARRTRRSAPAPRRSRPAPAARTGRPSRGR